MLVFLCSRVLAALSVITLIHYTVNHWRWLVFPKIRIKQTGIVFFLSFSRFCQGALVSKSYICIQFSEWFLSFFSLWSSKRFPGSIYSVLVPYRAHGVEDPQDFFFNTTQMHPITRWFYINNDVNWKSAVVRNITQCLLKLY